MTACDSRKAWAFSYVYLFMHLNMLVDIVNIPITTSVSGLVFEHVKTCACASLCVSVSAYGVGHY